MKKIILLAICLLCIAVPASAYQLYLVCPTSVQVGLPLKCTIDSNFPPGTTFNVVMYQTDFTATQVKTETVTIQEKQGTQYRIFDTSGLPGGNYKVEVKFLGNDEPRLSSDSKSLQLVEIVDRSDLLTITSPKTQDINEALRIEGSIAKAGTDGVQLEVRDPDGGKVYGPQWIGTTNDMRSGDGKFTQKVSVTTPGEYEVSFSDATGFIGTTTFKVVAPTPVTTTVIPTKTTVKVTKTPTAIPTSWPTTTQSPLSPFVGIGAVMIAGLLAVWVIRK